MSTYFGQFQRAFVENIAPWFLRQKNIATLLEATGLVLDGSVDSLLMGLRLSQPLRCRPEAFPALAKDRKIRLYATEPESSRRVRLSQWRQITRHNGSAYGKFINTQPYFLGADGKGVIPRMRIVHTNGPITRTTWHTMKGSYDPGFVFGGDDQYSIARNFVPNWDFDHLAHWSRWWGIIYTKDTPLDGLTHWDDGSKWDGGQFWDGAPQNVMNDLVHLFMDQGAPHAQCAGMILAHDIDSFDPAAAPMSLGDGTTTLPTFTGGFTGWGHKLDPVTQLPTRLQTASFIFDRYNN